MPREYQFGFELRHLVYFREVAEQLHFRRAAEALGVAQPALSRQIAQLEQALGARLFNRSKRRVELTPAGRHLREHVESLLPKLHRLPGELRALAAGETGLLRIGFTGLAMATVLPAILRRFHQQHPGVRLELNESPTSAQVQALLHGELSCGFLHPDPLPKGFESQQLLRERNGVVLPADHELATRPSLRLKDLAAVPFVLFPRTNNPGFYDRVLAAFRSAGVTPHIAEEVRPRANGLGLVRAGVGATFMCPSEAKSLPPDLVFRPLEGAAPESRLALVWRQTPESPPALPAFLAAASGA